MNKKGLTIAGLSESVMLILACIVCIGLIFVDMDYHYSQNFAGNLKLSNSTYYELQQATGTLKNTTESGEATTSAMGLSLSSSWGLILAIFEIMWTVVSGSWIPTIIMGMLHSTPGSLTIGIILQMAFLIGLILAVVRIFFRVRP